MKGKWGKLEKIIKIREKLEIDSFFQLFFKIDLHPNKSLIYTQITIFILSNLTILSFWLNKTIIP